MAERSMRPVTQAAVKIIQSGNTVQNNRDMQEFIRSNELRRDQIIALTSNETDIEDGDAVLTLFYRRNTIGVNSRPLDTLAFDSFNKMNSWEKQLKSVNEFRVQDRVVDVISVSRTPKNIGNARCQTIWYTTEDSQATTTTQLRRGDGDWHSLANEVHQWLEQHIPPHLLVSVSFYEEAHPNTIGGVNAVITHKCGAEPAKLADTAARTSLPSQGVYTMETVRNQVTELAVTQALEIINRRGGQEGHVVSTTNDTTQRDIFCVVFSWSPLLQDQIEESLRPATCAGCTIF